MDGSPAGPRRPGHGGAVVGGRRAPRPLPRRLRGPALERLLSETHHWADEGTGLRAVLVVDDTTLGPATGGVRTRAYPSEGEAVADARGLAQAMTIKCAAAGLDAGGGKIVVWRHGPDRQAAFVELGRRVEALGGGLLTAGDLGTTDEDLRAMARSTRFVHTGGRRLLAAAGRAMLRSVQACADVRGRAVGDLHVAIQGCGDIGTAAARALRAAGARVTVADLDAERAEALAQEIGGRACAPDEVLTLDVDVVSPCAVGGGHHRRRRRTGQGLGRVRRGEQRPGLRRS